MNRWIDRKEVRNKLMSEIRTKVKREREISKEEERMRDIRQNVEINR